MRERTTLLSMIELEESYFFNKSTPSCDLFGLVSFSFFRPIQEDFPFVPPQSRPHLLEFLEHIPRLDAYR